jgi:NodT family efflux transporter outer membrane factor (OMF) lipoprotein
MSRRFEVGSGSKLEVTQAATLLDQARTAHTALIQERDINRNALALLAGVPVRLDEGSLSPPTADEIPVGLSSDLLLFRPDVRAAELRLKAARANVHAARAAFFPSITLTGAFGTASAELDGLFRTGSESWSFSPAISLPLFDNGRTRANFDLAEARQNVAVADYERTVLSAFRDVSDALVLRRQLLQQVESLQSMVATARERTRLSQLRYDNGRSAYLEVLDAQRDLFDVEQRLVQVRRAHLATGLGLYAALGGNFAAPAPRAQSMLDTLSNPEPRP